MGCRAGVCRTVWGVLRAPRGDGKESLLLATPLGLASSASVRPGACPRLDPINDSVFYSFVLIGLLCVLRWTLLNVSLNLHENNCASTMPRGPSDDELHPGIESLQDSTLKLDVEHHLLLKLYPAHLI